MKRTPLAPSAKPMTRGAPLARTPFPARTSGLGRGGGLSRSSVPRATPCPEKAAPKPKRAGRSPMPKALAAYVLERSDGRCDRCARPLSELGFSRQHRRAHGMGGRAGAELHTAANVVVLCGSATTPGGCHNAAENAERALCEREGFVIKGEARQPEVVPILLHGTSWVVPTGDGWVAAQEPDAA